MDNCSLSKIITLFFFISVENRKKLQKFDSKVNNKVKKLTKLRILTYNYIMRSVINIDEDLVAIIHHRYYLSYCDAKLIEFRQKIRQKL